MESTYSVADIHGEAELLVDLLGQLQLRDGDTIVFLGDYIDRGPNSRSVIDIIIGLQKDSPANVVTLIGNHEDWLLKTLNDHTSHSWLISMAGLSTIRSYSESAAECIARELEQFGPQLFTERVELSYDRFIEAMPASHVRFFHELQLCYENDTGFFCHAGMNPDKLLNAQERQTLVWGDTLRFETYRGKPVVYGHWSNAFDKETQTVRPHRSGDTFGIDAISHGALIALELPSLTWHTASK